MEPIPIDKAMEELDALAADFQVATWDSTKEAYARKAHAQRRHLQSTHSEVEQGLLKAHAQLQHAHREVEHEMATPHQH